GAGGGGGRGAPAGAGAVAGAFTLACQQGHVRVFADEGPPMRALLGRVVAAHRAGRPPARGIPVGYLARVLRAFDGGPGAPGLGPAAGAGVPGIIDPLTGREREV